MASAPREGEAGRLAASDALRAAIINGDVSPGQRLVEPELAEAFDVTRASVRAALIDLTAEGLVERIPYRGARVRVVTVEEAVAITECRMVLEGLCAAKAATNATDDQIDSLVQLGTRMRAAVDEGEWMKYSALNREVHQMVQDIADQPVAAGLLQRLRGQIVRHQFRLAMRDGRAHVSLPEHLAIIDAIAQRNPDAAEHAARAHLRSVIAALRETES
jgi:DNA-binding GntR family transcriptional regulator